MSPADEHLFSCFTGLTAEEANAGHDKKKSAVPARPFQTRTLRTQNHVALPTLQSK